MKNEPLLQKEMIYQTIFLYDLRMQDLAHDEIL